jgi:heat shock protein HslJ
MEKLVANDHANMPVIAPPNLDGTWVLEYIADQKKPLDSLFPQKKPFIIFNSPEGVLSGNSGCNSFSGKIMVNGNKINFSGPTAITMMACPGGGEKIFLEKLIWVNAYSVTDKSLTLIKDDVAEMHFVRQQ